MDGWRFEPFNSETVGRRRLEGGPTVDVFGKDEIAAREAAVAWERDEARERTSEPQSSLRRRPAASPCVRQEAAEQARSTAAAAARARLERDLAAAQASAGRLEAQREEERRKRRDDQEAIRPLEGARVPDHAPNGWIFRAHSPAAGSIVGRKLIEGRYVEVLGG